MSAADEGDMGDAGPALSADGADALQQLQRATLRTSASVLRLQRQAEDDLRRARDALARQTVQLASQAALLQATLEAMADGLLAIDLGGRVVVRNSHFERLFSLPPGALEDDSDDALLKHMRPQFVDPERFMAVVLAQRADPEAVDTSRFKLLDGRLFERYGAPQRVNGRCVGYVVRWRDVTESQRAEEALAARKVAEQANTAKSAFLARMSHELRTPLNAIIGFSDMLLLDPAACLSARQREPLRHVRDAGGNLLQLINDVLDVSRLEAGLMTVTPRDVDVAVCVQEAVAQLQPMLAGAAVRLEIDLPTQPCMARADPLRLRQVLLNLLTNAVKYNRPGGAVRVRLACGERDASQRITIEVADTGLGMTPEQVACLFQPFNRLGREATGIEGTGIGLVIARSIMALMGGGIEVRSELGVGSTFTLELAASPVTAPDAAAPAAATAPIVRRDDVRGQVLYIDDNEVNRVLMSAFLSLRPNVELTLAEDGAQGLHAAMAKRPGLILIDLLLPGMDGFEVLRTLRARPELAGTPCLVVSASAMPEEIRRAEAAGFDGYLTKPLELSRLLSEIDQRLHAVAHADRSTP